MKSKLVFGREPAALMAFIAILIQFFSAFVAPVSETGQTVVNASVAAGFGLIVAWKVSDGVIAALTGLVQAVIVAGVHFGLELNEGQQTVLLTLITVAATAFVRQNVTAPVPPPAAKQSVASVS